MPAADDTNTVRLTRRFKAARDRVFAAFTSFDAMKTWFGPPGCVVLGGSLDFRVGGQYRLRMSTPMGEMTAIGDYREIAAPGKLVFTWRWDDDEDWAEVDSVVTIEFHAHGDETEMHFTHTGFPSAESRGNHEHGWTGCFDKLDTALAA